MESSSTASESERSNIVTSYPYIIPLSTIYLNIMVRYNEISEGGGFGQ